MGDMGDYWRDVKEHYREQKATKAQMQEENRTWETLEDRLKESGISIKKYDETGQWLLNGIIDWWTTTGTAIHRKTRQQFYFRESQPDHIIKILSNYK